MADYCDFELPSKPSGFADDLIETLISSFIDFSQKNIHQGSDLHSLRNVGLNLKTIALLHRGTILLNNASSAQTWLSLSVTLLHHKLKLICYNTNRADIYGFQFRNLELERSMGIKEFAFMMFTGL